MYRYQQRPSSFQPDILSAQTNSSRVLYGQSPMDPRKQPSDLLSDGSFLIIDKTQRNFIIALWVCLAFIFVLGFIIVGKMPQSYLKITESQSTCNNPVKVNHNRTYQCKDFDLVIEYIQHNPKKGIMVKGLTNKNIHIRLNAYFYFNDSTDNTLIDQKISINQYLVDAKDQITDHLFDDKFELTLDNYTLRNKFLTNESQTLGVKGSILYQHNIRSKNMLIIAEFESINEKPNIKNIDIEFLTINSQYTVYERNIRIVFFFFSLVSFAIYFILKKNIAESRQVIQHRLISYLTLFLVIFNNPLIAVLQTNNRFLIFLLQLSFLLLPTALVFFWLCMFERGQKQNTKQSSSTQGNVYNWGIIFLIFIFQFAMYLVDDYDRLVDYVGVRNELASFVGLRYTCFFVTLLGYVRIIYRIVKVYKNQESLVRYKRLASLSLPVIVFSFLFFLTMQYNVYSTEPKSIFLMVYLFNIYVYLLQFLYLKAKFNEDIFLPPNSQNMLVFPHQMDFPHPIDYPQPITIHDVPRRIEEKPKQNAKSMIVEMNNRSENGNESQIEKEQSKSQKDLEENFSIGQKEDQIKIEGQIGNVQEFEDDQHAKNE